MPKVYSANRSSVLVDGEALEGLQNLAFRVETEREDIRAIGSDERIDVSFGLRIVRGEFTVKSSADKLDTLLAERSKFQIVANLKKDVGMSTDATRTVSFDDCFVEGKSFALDAGGTASTIYSFTATRHREE